MISGNLPKTLKFWNENNMEKLDKSDSIINSKRIEKTEARAINMPKTEKKKQ